MAKELRQVIRAVERAGGRVVRGKKHYKAFGPDGRLITVLSASHGKGCSGDLLHSKRTLRKAGIDVD